MGGVHWEAPWGGCGFGSPLTFQGKEKALNRVTSSQRNYCTPNLVQTGQKDPLKLLATITCKLIPEDLTFAPLQLNTNGMLAEEDSLQNDLNDSLGN